MFMRPKNFFAQEKGVKYRFGEEQKVSGALLVSHLASYFMLILAWFMMLKGADPRWPSRIGSGL